MKTKLSVLLFITLAAFVSTVTAQNTGSTTKPSAAEQNKKLEAENAAMRRALASGNEAFRAEKYDEALDIFAKAINADPHHPGAPLMMVNFATAMYNRGLQTHAKAVAQKEFEKKEGGIMTALVDFKEAEETLRGAAALLRIQLSDAELKANATMVLKQALFVRSTVLFSLVKLNPTYRPETIKAAEEYIAAEPDRNLRIAARNALSLMLLAAGDYTKAAAEAGKVLNEENAKNDPDALFVTGMCLIVDDSNLKAVQSGANNLKLFLTFAPASHAKIKEAQDTLTYIKEAYGITPK